MAIGEGVRLDTPSGEEREVKAVGGTTIDGAPIAYVVALAAVVTVLAFIPLSVVIGSGKSFPMSQGIYPLVGWLLGPVAGALANGIGSLAGVFLAPHTSTMPIATVFGAAAGGLASGSMCVRDTRRSLRVVSVVVFVLAYSLYAGRAVLQNGASLWAVLLGSLINWSALLLFLLPTRTYFARWIGDQDLRKVAMGLFGGTWMIAGLVHLCTSAIIYFVLNWPNAVWVSIAPFAPFEHAVRCLVGTVIGTGVIAGLRAIGLVKPTYALY